MLPRQLESLVPGLAQARAEEQRNRALAFSGLTHTICGVEVCPMTPDHRLELQLVRNAFTFPTVEPLEGDVFQLFWVLSPARPKNNAKASWITAILAKRRLKRVVTATKLETLARAAKTYLADQLQDAPEGDADGRAIDTSAVHWMASEMAFWCEVHGGFTPESYRRTPYLVLQQLHRMWKINHPRIEYQHDGTPTIVEPQFINRSDRLAGAWIRARAVNIAEIIKSRRERLP